MGNTGVADRNILWIYYIDRDIMLRIAVQAGGRIRDMKLEEISTEEVIKKIYEGGAR